MDKFGVYDNTSYNKIVFIDAGQYIIVCDCLEPLYSIGSDKNIESIFFPYKCDSVEVVEIYYPFNKKYSYCTNDCINSYETYFDSCDIVNYKIFECSKYKNNVFYKTLNGAIYSFNGNNINYIKNKSDKIYGFINFNINIKSSVEFLSDNLDYFINNSIINFTDKKLIIDINNYCFTHNEIISYTLNDDNIIIKKYDKYIITHQIKLNKKLEIIEIFEICNNIMDNDKNILITEECDKNDNLIEKYKSSTLDDKELEKNKKCFQELIDFYKKNSCNDIESLILGKDIIREIHFYTYNKN